MNGPDPAQAAVLALAKSGEIAEAVRRGEQLIGQGATDASFVLFVGMLCCRTGELDRGIFHFENAVALAPDEVIPKVELARALLASGAFERAEVLASLMATLETPVGREMLRIKARALLQADHAIEAAACFQDLVDVDSADFESWDGLGASHLLTGEIDSAVNALVRATRLKPTIASFVINLTRAHLAAKNFLSAIEAGRKAVSLAPKDASALLELARALASGGDAEAALSNLDAMLEIEAASATRLCEIADVEFICKSFNRAEGHYRDALAADATLVSAWLGLGKLLERMNRTAELLVHIETAVGRGIDPCLLALLQGQALMATKQLQSAMESVLAAPPDVDPVIRSQLIGKIADRMGQHDVAFEAFADANTLLADSSARARQDARNYRETFAKMTQIVSSEWYASWPIFLPKPITAPRTPLFIFGFPRSGTTLIDTMLAGHPDTVVLEEEPAIDRLAEHMGPIERLQDLTARDVDDLRNFYFAEVNKIAPNLDNRLIVDKHPLGLGSTPLLHRIFPDARFIFVERHPYDVILSCFMTSADMDLKLADFYDFRGIALLYDQVLRFWEKCKSVLPIATQSIRYERLVVDPRRELRTLATFAGLDWDENVLDHQASVTARGYIGSPSYSQVFEPLYTRASGRWREYRQHMGAIDDLIAPWLIKLGYPDASS
jgi:tetratricopeptide (TPR) repeat protein